MTAPNVRRITGSSNPDSHHYTGLGHVDKNGAYHFPDGRTLPASGGIDYPDGRHTDGATTLVVQEDASPSTMPTPDAANPEWSALQRLHCVDRHRQDAYDRATFGKVGGDARIETTSDDVDPILPATNAGADPHSPEVRHYEVGSPDRDAAIERSRREHPERHQGSRPYTDPGSPYNPFPA
ncbi:hypothetical protein R4172_05615 [Rhodococcus kroppenstedtii]|uniref:hypothetical protein n=1 Tax=Rhodococcoides kroppenstedtii TaxID=293050 RepID=UPI002954D042|nr:hypothetical protein [Rhodococcus kroppenstedtii]MDV7197035.1 hypothetical protein [Rhodococcus kroppenstedtii]